METGKRTLIKAVIWNVMGLLVMSVIGFVATGSLAFGGKLAVANTIVGLCTYLIYERIWSRITWGRHV